MRVGKYAWHCMVRENRVMHRWTPLGREYLNESRGHIAKLETQLRGPVGMAVVSVVVTMVVVWFVGLLCIY